MNTLTQARDAVGALYADALDGINVFTIIPEEAVPPFAYLAPDDPYLAFAEAGLMFGEALANLRLVLVVEEGANDVKAAALDELLVKALLVDVAPFEVGEVGEPGRIQINGQQHLAAAVRLSAPVRLED